MSSLANLHEQSARLRIHLDELTNPERTPVADNRKALPLADSEFASAKELSLIDLDLMVTHVEVNNLHGTGILIKRMFPDSRRILHVWTCKAYGVNEFGIVQHFVSGWETPRYKMYEKALEALRSYQIRRVMCVPFSAEDLHVALAMSTACSVPLMIYVMDDQNLASPRIPNAVLAEAFARASVVFAISPEMRDAYETKFGIKCHILPPVVPADSVAAEPIGGIEFPDTGIMLGNIWNAQWLEEIRRAFRDSGVTIHWYGNAGKLVEFSEKDLEKDGIVFKGALPEREICAQMRKYGFGVLPSSPDDQEDWLAKYSIPTRLVTSVAAGNLPMIVVGTEQSASSRFVRRFGVGLVSPYDPQALREAAAAITQAEKQREFRENAAKCAALFSDADIDRWLWESLEKKVPADDRFEKAFGREEGSMSAWIEPAAPRSVHHSLHESYYPCRRLAKLGCRPDFFIDAGASNGVFSDMISQVFPETRLILVEPLAKIYREQNDWFFKKHPEFEIIEAALSDQPGRATFHVAGDLFNSSLLSSTVTTGTQPVDIEVKTLDTLAAELGLTGRGLLKLDVQCTEHLVLAGGPRLLEQIDGIMLELSLVRFAPQAKVFKEMLELLDSLGFRYFDECGGWRSPKDGRLLQKDVLFLRKGFLEADAASQEEN